MMFERLPVWMVVIVSTAALLAPAHKSHVAGVVFLAGCLVAAYLGWTAEAWKEFISAVLAGLVTLWFFVRRIRRHRPEPVID